MSKRSLLTTIAAISMFIAMSLTAIGQEITGNIVGTVRDANGANVVGATVTITNPAQNITIRTVTTNGDGEFSAPNIAPGVYTVTVEAANFKKSVQTDVKVDVGQRRAVDVSLAAGRIDETVTVQADPVGVDLQSAQVGTLISGEQVREISVNNRNFTQLVTLAPGVTNDLSDQVYVGTTSPANENNNTGAQANQPNIVSISVNGNRSSQNSWIVDGADVTDRGSNLTIQAYPSLDSIAEFRVLRSMFPAESGRSGGGQVNIITRTGGREFHGSLFEFVRNEAFNANDFFSNTLAPVGRDADGNAKRRPFRYNNFGGTIGGPVYFFNFGENDGGMFRRWEKTFFFFSQEFRRDIRYPTLNGFVPTAALKTGVFTVPICVQAVGANCTQFLSAGTPLSTLRPINPLAQQYVNEIYNNLPNPTNPNTFALIAPTFNKAEFRQEIIKIDHSFSDRLSAFYRYQRDKIPTIDANAIFSSGSNLPGVSTTETDSPGRTHTTGFTYVLSPKMIVEGRYAYGYGAILSKNIGLLALANSPITPPMPYANTRDRVPSITFAGATMSNLGGFGPYDNFSWKQNMSGNFTWISGNHTMKYGAVFSLYRKNENALAGNNEGVFSGFNTPGGTTSVACTTATCGSNGTQIQQQWANFLIGTNVTFSQASFDYTADLRQKAIEWYAQDEWRFNRNTTLYFGVRYSYFGSPWDKNGRLTNFVPSLWTTAESPLVTGAGNRVAAAGKNFCNGLIVNAQNVITPPAQFNCTPKVSPWGKYVVDAPKMDFAPRVGIAWDPFGKGKTSLRMGYGMYHDQVLNGTLLQQIGLNPPYQQTCTVTGVNMSNPVPGGNCTVASAATAQNIRALEPDWKTPYAQHWSLDVQQSLGNNTAVSIGYYGSKGVHLIGAYELNEIPAGYALSLGATGCATGASTTPTVACQAPGAAFTSAAQTNILDQLRPYRGYRSINMVKTQYNANYHSMQIAAKHRFRPGSEVNVAYTWSKNLTDNQTDRSSAPQNSFNIRQDYGRAALDRRHVFTTNYFYLIPLFEKRNDFVETILGGWKVSGVVTYQTGLPLTVTTSNFDAAGLGFITALVAGGRPLTLCDGNVGGAQTAQQWFNTSCYRPNTATPIPNVIGNAARGGVNGPPTFRTDLTLSKSFSFGENMRLQLRGEAFNIFNRTNFRAVSTNITAANFGQVISVRDPRQLQFGAKFYF